MINLEHIQVEWSIQINYNFDSFLILAHTFPDLLRDRYHKKFSERKETFP